MTSEGRCKRVKLHEHEHSGSIKVEDLTPQRPSDDRLAEILARYEAGAPRGNGHAQPGTGTSAGKHPR